MKLEKKLNIKLDNVIINNIDVDDYVTKDEYNSKVEELNTTKEDLIKTETELSNSQLELDSTKEILIEKESELNSTKSELSETKSELSNTKIELDNTKETLTSTQSELNSTKSELDEVTEDLNEANIKIEELKNEVIDWSQIGYTQMPQLISDGFEYAKIIVSNASYYNDSTTFENDMQLVYFPTIDWSNVSMFNYKFANCSRLQYVGKINGNKMNPNFTYTFQNCPALHTIELLELDYAVINFTTFNGSDYVTNLTCTNLGKIFRSTTFQFGNLQYWSYQTMIDSLLNYSYDRSGETDIITIELHADAKARLTDADIAAITAKGYTIA